MENLGDTQETGSFDLKWVQDGELPDVGELLAGSLREDLRFVKRLCDDWAAGINRFDKPGEGLLVALDGARVVAVCGLNRDPFAAGEGVGRVRRFYVLPAYRRQGLGGRMLDELVARAHPHFTVLRVHSHEARDFYLTHAFRPLEGDPDASHERVLGDTR
jgi:GNAT superfamily N-acetyltransferase